MSAGGRPIVWNLRRDGWRRCAEYVSSVLRHNRGAFLIYVADDGGLRAIARSSTRQTRPAHEWVGTYDKTTRTEYIEDDLIARLQELAA